MDTGTHLVMGIALGGLATIDSSVTQGSVTAHAVMAGTIIGSQAPDLDTILKLKNNAKYIRNHRGITHSLTAVLLWPILITAAISIFASNANILHVWLWTFLAVMLHVFVDIFNAYGTQAIRPFSKRWVAFGMINTFDPYIFVAHLIALLIWANGGNPAVTFPILYSIILIYYFLRYYSKRRIVMAAKKVVPDAIKIIVSPTMRFYHWRLAITTDAKFYVAKGVKNKITIVDEFNKLPVPNSPVMDAAMKDENLSAFLSFSPVYRWEVDEYNDHYEVRFIDLRYRSKGYYPFVAVVQLNQDLDIVSSYTGWIFSENKLMSKLDILPD